MSQPNWLGLLQWSLAYSDGTTESSGKTLSLEDKEWLERVMKESVKDEPGRLNQIMLDLSAILDGSSGDFDEETIENHLEEIKSIVDQIDMAQVFTKFGGAKCLLRIMAHETISYDIKALSSSVIGTLAQNNVIVQDILYKDGVLESLIKHYLSTDSVKFCTKILYAVSCLIRNHPALEVLFMLHYAQPSFEKAFTSGNEALGLRAVFLSNALLMSDSATAERIEQLSMWLLPAVVRLLDTNNVDLYENVLLLLTTLLHTERGFQLLTQTYASDLAEALRLREHAVAGDEALSDEEAAQALRLLEQLKLLASQPLQTRYPRPTITEMPATAANTVLSIC